MYHTQVIVTSELPPEENLYLHCMRRSMDNSLLAQQLLDDYQKHQDETAYIKYMEQLTRASINSKGESAMICEGILNICGTSSKEIEDRTKAIYLPQIEKLNTENSRLLAEVETLKSRLALYEEV